MSKKRKDIKKKVEPIIQELPSEAPLIPIRDMVIFPNAILPLVVGRDKSVNAIDAAENTNGYIVITSQMEAEKDSITAKDLFRTGTLARILQVLRLPNNYLKVVVESLERVQINKFLPSKKHFQVKFEILDRPGSVPQKVENEIYNLLLFFKEYVKEHHELPEELFSHAEQLQEPERIIDFIALNVEAGVQEKQRILEANDLQTSYDLLVGLLKYLIGFIKVRKQVDSEVRDNIMGIQREHYLQEQLRVIRKELGEDEQGLGEIQKLEDAILAADMPSHAFEKATEELDKLKKTPPFSPEYGVTRNYIDWMLQVPWSKRSEDRVDIVEAQKILDEDHYGLEKPKERIIEHLAVMQRVKKIKGPILCFVGPPGVGKTSLGRSIARALNREFVRVSLGGVRDEAEIRGHRRTYIGSMPGKVIQSMKRAGTKNPVFLLDEIDKMSMDFRGDPSAALLEVLDPEQNKTFNDHYLDLDYDLSEIFFITTANNQSNIPLPLQDRMEIIELPGYLEHEKEQIARRYLIPKQKSENGLTEKQVQIDTDSLIRILREYTREAGVRNLEREIAKVCRKATRMLIEKKNKRSIKVTAKNVEKFLGKPSYLNRQIELENRIGEALGLAWTPYGGDLLKIEVNIFGGEGKLTLTGKLGDVMKESAQTALSYVRSIADQLKLDPEIFRKKDIHIHVPEGAIPKDGPSAGITLATAMISALTERKVKGNIAMTGEITLRGRVLAIGGLNEKMLAAQRNNIAKVLVPAENDKEINDLPDELRGGIKIVQVKNYEEVLKEVLI